MVHNYETLGSVTRTENISVSFDDLVDLLSSGLPSINYWGGVDWNEDGYAKAKESLRAHPKFKNEKILCFEEILVEGLRKHLLTLDIHDYEGDMDYQLELVDIIHGISVYFNMELGVNFDDMDGCMADCIMQCACFGEVVYG